MQHKIALASDLRRAIESHVGLAVHYQPQIDLATNRVTGFEALMRWTHPIFGSVPPSEFIPIAESSQLICELGVWIMREAARQAKSWLDAGEPEREVAVNVSAAQLWNTDLVDEVARILEETGLPPHLLCLELTESLLADHSEARFRGVLLALKKLGVMLALDDFGTDYSSLGYLTQLPFDKLEIDRVFVDDITEAPRGPQTARRHHRAGPRSRHDAGGRRRGKGRGDRNPEAAWLRSGAGLHLCPPDGGEAGPGRGAVI